MQLLSNIYIFQIHTIYVCYMDVLLLRTFSHIFIFLCHLFSIKISYKIKKYIPRDMETTYQNRQIKEILGIKRARLRTAKYKENVDQKNEELYDFIIQNTKIIHQKKYRRNSFGTMAKFLGGLKNLTTIKTKITEEAVSSHFGNISMNFLSSSVLYISS